MKEYFSDEKNTQFQKQAQKFVDKQNKKDQNKKSPPLYLANAKNKRPLGSSLGVVALFLTATFVLFMVISSYWENNHISDAPYPLQPQEASNPPSVHLLDTVQAAETFSDTLYKLPLALDNIPVPEPEPDIELDTEQVLEPQDEKDDIVEANVE
ncbi:MAG: hypothetical protein FWG43_06575, partial [Clostridiales bacterium]|nr:hypothetical protein [Clostridiales bacterium]